MSAYANYVRCRALRIAIRAVDLDAVTTEILYVFQTKIDEVEDAKRKKDKPKGGRR